MIDPSFKFEKSVGEKILGNFYLRMCSVVNSPLARHCADLFQRGQYASLLDVRADPNEYGCAYAFSDDYLISSFLTRFPDFDLGIDKEAAAFRKWQSAEESCGHVNDFLRSEWAGESPYPLRVSLAFARARQKIRQILGKVDYDFIRVACRFGPGIDLSTSGAQHATYNKFETSGSATPWVLPVYSEIFSEDFREDYLHEAQLLSGNKLAFVPKNAKIYRPIGVEPRWNIYLQLGIGELIVRRLKAIGIDLSDQSLNQQAAARAHRAGLATIDLSSASDSLSKNLVLWLLPEEWSDLLFRTRSPRTSYKGESRVLEKVSSMGNGYTFPLETLIFYALSLAAVESSGDYVGEVRVYGDDIIVPRHAAATTLELLSYAGFSVNTDKTFVKGRFFESCGCDYLDGVNVRPFFQRKGITEVFDLYTLANQLLAYACRGTDFADAKWKALWEWTISKIPRRARLYGPRGVSGVIHAPLDMCCPVRAQDTRNREGWEGWVFPCWTPQARKREGHSYYGHLYTKISADVDTGQEYVVPRNFVWRRRRAYVPTYREFQWV